LSTVVNLHTPWYNRMLRDAHGAVPGPYPQAAAVRAEPPSPPRAGFVIHLRITTRAQDHRIAVEKRPALKFNDSCCMATACTSLVARSCRPPKPELEKMVRAAGGTCEKKKPTVAAKDLLIASAKDLKKEWEPQKKLKTRCGFSSSSTSRARSFRDALTCTPHNY
jgi:hypothetical protein